MYVYIYIYIYKLVDDSYKLRVRIEFAYACSTGGSRFRYARPINAFIRAIRALFACKDLACLEILGSQNV